MNILYASLYPSIIRQFNVAAHTQIGMILIKDQINEHENRQNDPTYSRGGQFLEDFRSHQWLEIGTRWFNLANFTELVKDTEVFFKTIMMPMIGLRTYDSQGHIQPMFFCDNSSLPSFGMYFYEDDRNEVYRDFNINNAKVWRDNAIKTPNQQFQ